MTWRTAIQKHYEKIWQIPATRCPSIGGPLHELPDDFTILKFAPRQERRMWTYATSCMSKQEDADPLELHMFSRDESEEIVELLTATAHFHRTGKTLGFGHTVNFGKPWQRQSVCDHGLISLPYLDGPSLENLNIGSKLLNCYWLIPITKSEVKFKKKFELEALEQKLEDHTFDYLNPTRPSVV
jgi:hypothetical protein